MLVSTPFPRYTAPMLEKPGFPDDQILACLQDAYGLQPTRLDFLPLGYDPHTAVYRAVAVDGTPYFVRLRSGPFDELSVTLPRFLRDQGITRIITPLRTLTGRLWARLDPFQLILYPFLQGHDVYEADLSDEQWRGYGAALRRIHDATFPPALLAAIRKEDYTPRWRDNVRRALNLGDGDIVPDPVAREAAALLRAERATILALLDRATRLAQALQAAPPPSVVCHSDLHAGNFLVTDSGDFYLVDWDEPILAPKERDLMYPGAGLMGNWRTPEQEEAIFYQGYGPATVDRRALAYYRAERIIADIAVYCEELLLSTAGGADRPQSLRYLQSNFQPGGPIARAYAVDETAPA
jgi:spectinomycin phosphotransferase